MPCTRYEEWHAADQLMTKSNDLAGDRYFAEKMRVIRSYRRLDVWAFTHIPGSGGLFPSQQCV